MKKYLFIFLTLIFLGFSPKVFASNSYFIVSQLQDNGDGTITMVLTKGASTPSWTFGAMRLDLSVGNALNFNNDIGFGAWNDGTGGCNGAYSWASLFSGNGGTTYTTTFSKSGFGTTVDPTTALYFKFTDTSATACSGGYINNVHSLADTSAYFATPPLPSINFDFPTNNTSTPIADFTNWNFSINNIDFVDYTIRVIYWIGNASSSGQLIQTDQQELFSAYTNASSSIPKSVALINNGQPPIMWSAFARLENKNTGQITDIHTPIITFVVNAVSPIVSLPPNSFFGTSTEPLILNTTSTYFTLQDCSTYEISLFSSSTLGGISCIANNVWKNIFNSILNIPNVLGSRVSSFYSNSITIANSTFPLSLFISINTDINLAQTTTTDEILNLQGKGNAFKKHGGGYYNFTFLSSSTLAWITNAGLNLRDFFGKIIYLITAGVMIMLVVAVVISTQPPK